MLAVSINHVSDSILLEYDETMVSESDLMGWMDRLVKVAIEKYKEQKSDANIHSTLLHIQAAMQDEIDTIRTDNDSE
jgi:uncharacterized GH25 family protein